LEIRGLDGPALHRLEGNALATIEAMVEMAR